MKLQEIQRNVSFFGVGGFLADSPFLWQECSLPRDHNFLLPVVATISPTPDYMMAQQHCRGRKIVAAADESQDFGQRGYLCAIHAG